MSRRRSIRGFYFAIGSVVLLSGPLFDIEFHARALFRIIRFFIWPVDGVI
jgi:hypothetical protein